MGVFAAQVALTEEWLDLHGVVAAPVIPALDGWEHVYPLKLDADEVAGSRTAAEAITAANEAAM